tara:strand:+ start:751 stop:1212 length:462 start_codon:yes stop_codon:yes gene_type:complete
MEVHGHHISIESLPTKKYIVRVAYLRNQMFSDPTNTDIDQENATAFEYTVDASSCKQAIDKALTINMVVQAEAMMKWPMIIPEEMTNKDAVISFGEFLEERELFSAWMTIDPTSIQCTAVDDKELLETLTENNIMSKAKNMPKDIEDFLNKEK